MPTDAQILGPDTPPCAGAVMRTLDRMLETIGKAVANRVFGGNDAPRERPLNTNKAREPPVTGDQAR